MKSCVSFSFPWKEEDKLGENHHPAPAITLEMVLVVSTSRSEPTTKYFLRYRILLSLSLAPYQTHSKVGWQHL